MKYILIAFIFCACKNITNHATPPISKEVLDTITTLPSTIRAEPLLFETAFVKGTTQKVRNSIFNLYGVTIGSIKTGSGHIVACDPMHIDEYGKPFTQTFPTGEFPVQLSIGKLGNEEIIAFARINFSDEPVERWEFALLDGQASIPVGGEKKHGYSVDAGVGIFIDEEAMKALDAGAVEDMDGEVYQEMDRHYHNTWRYAMYSFGIHNLAAFTSGFGDGYYATYIGFDAKGKPCRLVTDFGIFDWKK